MVQRICFDLGGGGGFRSNERGGERGRGWHKGGVGMPVNTCVCVGEGVCHKGGVGMPVDTCVCVGEGVCHKGGVGMAVDTCVCVGEGVCHKGGVGMPVDTCGGGGGMP